MRADTTFLVRLCRCMMIYSASVQSTTTRHARLGLLFALMAVSQAGLLPSPRLPISFLLKRHRDQDDTLTRLHRVHMDIQVNTMSTRRPTARGRQSISLRLTATLTFLLILTLHPLMRSTTAIISRALPVSLLPSQGRATTLTLSVRFSNQERSLRPARHSHSLRLSVKRC